MNALKNWMDKTPLDPPHMEPDDWSRVRAIQVCDLPRPVDEGNRMHQHLMIYADVPERPRLFWVERRIDTGSFLFGANHR